MKKKLFSIVMTSLLVLSALSAFIAHAEDMTGLSYDDKLKSWYPVRLTELNEEEVRTYIGSKYTVYPEDTEEVGHPMTMAHNSL